MVEMTRAVEDVLDEIGAGDRPRLLVLNKADQIGEERREELRFRHSDGILVSALTGEGLDALGEAVERAFRATLRRAALPRPFDEGGRLAELHDVAGDLERTDTAEGVRVRGRVPATVAERFARFDVSRNGAAADSAQGRPPAPAGRGTARERVDPRSCPPQERSPV